MVTINKQTALEFLRTHQPLPGDAELTEEEIQTFDAVSRFFQQHPDREAVPLLVNAFGDGSGFGVYQLVEDTLAQHDHEDVVTALDRALKEGGRGVRYWAAHNAARFPDQRLCKNLIALLANSDADDKLGLREAAIVALEFIGGNEAIAAMELQLTIEQDPYVRNIIVEALGSIATRPPEG
jgi:HEAT repeat protein